MRRAILGLIGLVLLFSIPAIPAQQAGNPSPTSTANTDTDKNASEISSHEQTTTFQVNVNLVLIRAVVRDTQGRAVGNLKKEDFELLDNRKPQVISRFSLEDPKTKVVAPIGAGKQQPVEASQIVLPDRYVAYLFDDIHWKFSDLALVRQAAVRHLATLQPTDRAAIFTTSGRDMQDFTADKEKLQNALMRLNTNSVTTSRSVECPDIDFYMADQIQNKNDQTALALATDDALACAYQNDPQMRKLAEILAQQTAQRQFVAGNHETQVSLFTLQDVVKRLSILPGQRSIILISPGFYNPDNLPHQIEIADRALRSGIVINALDARGLYTLLPGGDIDRPSGNTNNSPGRNAYTQQAAIADADVLVDFANATGGSFFHNSNDLDQGLRRLAEPPEYSYLLGFSPQGLKSDGKFHNLKVMVKSPEKLTVQARKGYFAPQRQPEAAEQAKQDLEDAVFSQEELHALPVELHTQFFKASDNAAQIAVLVRVDLRGLHFKKVDGRNRNELTIVSAVFDLDGNYVKGNEKVLEMRLLDETLQRRTASGAASGMVFRSNFDVAPGSYMVRLVVRDAEGQISAENGAVEIPY